MITAAQVFQRSSNIGTVKIARQLGKQRLYEAMLRFGLGRRTGVGLAGERAGVVYPVQKWGDIHFANIAFGYGLQVTPLQMVAGYAAIANGGMYNPPRLVAKVVHADGREEPFALPPGARPSQRVVSAGDGANDAGDHDRGHRAEARHRQGGRSGRASRWRARPAPPRRW